MKRKILALMLCILLISILFCGTASASQSVIRDTFNSGFVYLDATIDIAHGDGMLFYDNSAHEGTAYTNYILVTLKYEIAPLIYGTKTKSNSKLNDSAYASIIEADYTPYSVKSQGTISQLGEVWNRTTPLAYYP